MSDMVLLALTIGSAFALGMLFGRILGAVHERDVLRYLAEQHLAEREKETQA